MSWLNVNVNFSFNNEYLSMKKLLRTYRFNKAKWFILYRLHRNEINHPVDETTHPYPNNRPPKPYTTVLDLQIRKQTADGA